MSASNRVVLATAVMAAVVNALPAAAQPYPSRPVRFIVPFAPGPALTDTIAGQVQFMIATMPAAASHPRSGKLRGLGVSGAKRSPAFPDLPTIAEAGVAGYEYATWYGVLAPGKTPRPIVERLLAATHTALADPGLRERLQQNGMEPEANNPQHFMALLRQDIARWGKIIRAAGIQPQ